MRAARRLGRRALLYASVAAVCAVVLFPAYWMLVISIRPTRYTINYPPEIWPEVFKPDVYLEMFRTVPIGLWLRNSALVGSGIMLLTIVLSVLAGYAFSSLAWRGRSAFGVGLLITQMLPEALLVIPIVYSWLRRRGRQGVQLANRRDAA